jgi:hypothetical protein
VCESWIADVDPAVTMAGRVDAYREEAGFRQRVAVGEQLSFVPEKP